MDDNTNIEGRLGRLEGKIDIMTESIKELNAHFITLASDRLSRIEITIATINTKIMMYSIVSSFVASGLLAIGLRYLLK